MNHVAIPLWLKESGTDRLRQADDIAWLTPFRRAAWDAFLAAGLPTRRHERWKYADLSWLDSFFPTVIPAAPSVILAQAGTHDDLAPISMGSRLRGNDNMTLVFINGSFAPHLSTLHPCVPGMILCSLSEALKHHEALVKIYWSKTVDTKNDPFANFNHVMFNDGLFLYLPDDCTLRMPLHLTMIANNDHSFMAHPRHLIVMGKSSQATLIEETISTSDQIYWMNSVTQIFIDQHAKLNYCKIQHAHQMAIHMANMFIEQQQNSCVDFTSFSSGSLFARDDLSVTLKAQGATCKTAGFYRLKHNQYVDHHVDIHHLAPNSLSEMLYKGILDKNARAVFNGKLYVGEQAQKTSAYQANHHLLLSNEAEAFAKPELEIYADDVKCKHGATVGQLDQEALFYLCSRGIEKQEAMQLLLQGFAEDIMQRITHPHVLSRVREMMA